MKASSSRGYSKHGSLNSNNVISLCARRNAALQKKTFRRIAPELDGLEILYGNNANPDKLYSLKIACWSLDSTGKVQGMVPWLNKLMPCTEINDPLDGQWQGYRNPHTNEVFYEAPAYKVEELTASARFYCPKGSDGIATQTIPDSIGTHAALTHDGFKTLTLIEIHSWRLNKQGQIDGMLVDYNQVQSSPVLAGDRSLVEARNHPEFKYFFQHHMANKIKNHDPEAIAAISMLIESNRG